MIKIRPFQSEDAPALQTAIDNDTIHPGTWSVKEFTMIRLTLRR